MPVRGRSKSPRLHAIPAGLCGAVFCAAPFLLLPLALYDAPEHWMNAGLYALLFVLCPVLSLLIPALVARAGVPSLLACLLPALGYAQLLWHSMEPEVWVLILSLVLSVVSASIGQELYRRNKKTRKKATV